MNRQIKFRAWDSTKEKMVSWEQITHNSNLDLWGGYFDLFNREELQPMQYTGLKDKNGKEIYEGDVVILDHWKSQDIFDYSKPFSVTWQDGQIDFRQGLYHNFIGSMNGKIDLRIIGNIYENPE